MGLASPWPRGVNTAQELAASSRASSPRSKSLIGTAPTAGTKYTTTSGKPFKRVLMLKSKNHVYFEVDEARGIVHAIRVAPRGRGPAL